MKGIGSPPSFLASVVLAPMLVLALAVPIATPRDADANALTRDRDPVELTGASLPSLIGVTPSHIVGFRYEFGWVQIPIQVDERGVVDFGAIYDTTAMGQTFLTYTDGGTFTGTDPDPLFDATDELVFMAREAGFRAGGVPEPAGVVAGTGVELRLTNTTTSLRAYVYLFNSGGALPPDAGAPPIGYTFALLSGDYKTTYNTQTGPNPENSTVVTSAYSVHFADRWIRDETAITLDGATGVDILDRHKSLFAPGNCARSENTFSAGEGAFIVNRAGPVRALRGYVGANSGPTTHRIHKFYEEREDILTVLRVHAISGVMDYFDYSPAATGMTYQNDLNPAGALIDGNPTADVIVPGPFVWEQVSGAQGTLVSSLTLNTDIPLFDYSSYYSDDATPQVTQCTGDNSEYGASGFWEADPVPNTDPGLGEFNVFEVVRHMVYGGPGQTTEFVEQFVDELANPLAVEVGAYMVSTTGLPGDDPGTAALKLTASPNPFQDFVRIRFARSRPGTFRLDVFDVRGRLVTTWAEGSHGVGTREVLPDVGGLPSGVYLVRVVTSDGLSRTVRMVHIR